MRSISPSVADVLSRIREADLEPEGLQCFLDDLRRDGVEVDTLIAAARRFLWEAARLEVVSEADSTELH